MPYECESCGNKEAHRIQVMFCGKDGKRMNCDQCGVVSGGVPDVYFKNPYWDEGLSSQEYPGAKFISSRADKKFWLDKCKLREAGDRVHGATSFDPISHRHAQESLRRKGYGG